MVNFKEALELGAGLEEKKKNLGVKTAKIKNIQKRSKRRRWVENKEWICQAVWSRALYWGVIVSDGERYNEDEESEWGLKLIMRRPPRCFDSPSSSSNWPGRIPGVLCYYLLTIQR